VITTYRSEFVPGFIGTAAGKHGIWFSERGRLTRIDEATDIREFAYLADAFGPADLAVAPDGTIWAAGHGVVERFSPSGLATLIRVGEPGAGPFGIAVDRAGRLWFAMDRAVGVIKTEDDKPSVTTYDAGAGSSPEGIVVDADGTAWCTDMRGAILRVSTDGKVRRFALPSMNAEPFGITIGPDNAVWFTEFYNNSVGRLDPSTGRVVEYPLGPPHRFPTSIVAADGALWFLDLSGFLGRISTSGNVTEMSVPTPSP
jgi:streptogramin lyase